ncbi:globin domain-containing protein [Bosea sp. (in: a-proteobacteria)]|uniref:globin domain-containing protein n=1 Tax=Bosea sp. (in: a-proteobacteria) TaxID=1871050 RepID=UPI002FC9D1CD
MTPQDVELIRSSFAQLHRRKAETAQLFYGRLFAIAPATRPLFKGDIKAQGAKLMETLMVALATLSDPAGLTILLERLGSRHRGYGVRPEHYDAVRAALLWTVEQTLGPSFTADIRIAWTALYDQMAAIMLGAAARADEKGAASLEAAPSYHPTLRQAG